VLKSPPDYSTEGWIYFLKDYGNTVNLNLLGGDLVERPWFTFEVLAKYVAS
jgi:hypothetical protein